MTFSGQPLNEREDCFDHGHRVNVGIAPEPFNWNSAPGRHIKHDRCADMDGHSSLASVNASTDIRNPIREEIGTRCNRNNTYRRIDNDVVGDDVGEHSAVDQVDRDVL